MDSEETSFTYSVVVSKDGKPYISVMFERGEDCAEGSVPACEITKSKGFSSKEVEQMENYLRENKKKIIKGAQEISELKRWLS